MNAVLLFIVLAGVLTLAILAILLLPWWRRPRTENQVDRHQANLEVFRDQLRELERDRDEGLLAPGDFAQAKDELQSRLLAETDARTVSGDAAEPSSLVASAFAGGGRISWRGALFLAVAVPLAAVSIYVWLGNPQGLLSPQLAADRKAQEVEAMLSRLAGHLETNPDDARGWVILARAYKSLARFPEAADAFDKVRTLVDTDPALLADHAYVLIQADGGVVGQRAEHLLDRALSLDPEQPQALFMTGFAASERGDFKRAVERWERLLPQLEPGSEEAAAIEQALDKARKAIAAQPADKPDRQD